MEKVAVVAHNQKILGGGLGELRRVLAEKGISDPLWYEVDKSRKFKEELGQWREPACFVPV